MDLDSVELEPPELLRASPKGVLGFASDVHRTDGSTTVSFTGVGQDWSVDHMGSSQSERPYLHSSTLRIPLQIKYNDLN